MSNVIHFESLWEMSEVVSKDQHSTTTEALQHLKELVETLIRIHTKHQQNPTNEVGKHLKRDQVGSILFAITAISALENIDVYAALKNIYEVAKFQKELDLSGFDQLAEKVSPSENTSIESGESLTG